MLTHLFCLSFIQNYLTINFSFFNNIYQIVHCVGEKVLLNALQEKLVYCLSIIYGTNEILVSRFILPNYNNNSLKD